LDELKEGLNENGCYTLGYADYITITGKFPNTVSELLQGASGMVNSGVIGLSYLSIQKDRDNFIHKEKRFKGPKETSPLWT